MRMRPTRRGYVVVAVVVGAVAAGAVFGARALDAVVLPGVVALAAAVLQLRRASVPAVNRTLPPAETAGVERTITLSLDGDSGVPATVRDRLPAGVAAAPPGGETREAALENLDEAVELHEGGGEPIEDEDAFLREE